MAGRKGRNRNISAHNDILNKPENHIHNNKNGDKVVTKKFNIKPKKKCSVQNVGFRPTLVCKSIDYDVKVCPFNRKDRSVDVIIKGTPKNIQRYWRDIKAKKIMPPLEEDFDGKCVDFEVSELEDWKEMTDNDIDYCVDALQLGQSRRGIKAINEMGKNNKETWKETWKKMDENNKKVLKVLVSDKT